MKLALIGSRNFCDYADLKQCINRTFIEWNITIGDIDTIVSGGARGADTLAEKFAKEYNLNIIICKPNWNKHPRAAGILRNTDIINTADCIIAFPSRSGRGTQDSIRKANAAYKKCKVFYID